MEPAVTIGLDIAKSVFQIHGVGATGDVVVRQRLSRGKVLQFSAKIPACLVGLEAFGAAHYWGRELRKLGHDARLMVICDGPLLTPLLPFKPPSRNVLIGWKFSFEPTTGTGKQRHLRTLIVEPASSIEEAR